MTVSNSRPLARCSVITLTGTDASAAGSASGSAQSSASAATNADQSVSSPACSCSSNKAKKRSAVLKSTASSTHAGPASASQPPRTCADSRARPRAARAGASALARRVKRVLPSSVSPGIAFAFGSRSAIDRERSVSAAATIANRSCSVRPHHGARRTASQARRSAGCTSAWVSEARSRIACRSAKWSSSTAANGIPAPRSAGRSASRCVRARTSIAMLLAPAASALRRRSTTALASCSAVLTTSIVAPAPSTLARVGTAGAKATMPRHRSPRVPSTGGPKGAACWSHRPVGLGFL